MIIFIDETKVVKLYLKIKIKIQNSEQVRNKGKISKLEEWIMKTFQQTSYICEAVFRILPFWWGKRQQWMPTIDNSSVCFTGSPWQYTKTRKRNINKYKYTHWKGRDRSVLILGITIVLHRKIKKLYWQIIRTNRRF